MAHDSTLRKDRLVYLDTQAPLPALADLALSVAVTVTKWTTRRRTRRALRRLPPYLLRDIGLTEHQAQREAARPFWRDDD